MKKVSYLNAVRDGIAEEMRKDPTIFMIGEGISERGGSYAQTKDLWAEFGDERIVDAPISENGWAALSVGAAENGLRPIMDIMICDIINEMGLDSIVSPKAITCASILRYVRARVNGEGTKVERLYRLMNGKAEALEFIARDCDPYINIPLKKLTRRPNSLIAVIVRRGKVIVPFGNDHIENGDSVIVIVCESGIGDLNEVIYP